MGPIDRWHHVGCFIKNKNDLGWSDEYTANMLTNFKSLDADDREIIKKHLDKKKYEEFRMIWHYSTLHLTANSQMHS